MEIKIIIFKKKQVFKSDTCQNDVCENPLNTLANVASNEEKEAESSVTPVTPLSPCSSPIALMSSSSSGVSSTDFLEEKKNSDVDSSIEDHVTSPVSSPISSSCLLSSSNDPHATTMTSMEIMTSNHSVMSSKKKEGLEDAADRMLSLLQEKGQMNFKQIHKELGLDYRRAYDILNVLTTTPLVSKRGKNEIMNNFIFFLMAKIMILKLFST